jgi:cytochrome c556
MAESFYEFGSGIALFDGDLEIHYGTLDPSASGVAAPEASLYLRSVGGDAEIYQKTGGTDTDWSLQGGDVSAEIGYIRSFIGKAAGDDDPDYSSENVIADADSLETALGKIDTKIGADPSANSRTNNPISPSGALQENIEALDDAIGSDSDLSVNSRTLGLLSSSQTVIAMIDSLDEVIGPDSDMANQNYVAPSGSVFQNLSELDGQVKTNEDAISSLQAGYRIIGKVKVVTGDDISSASGTGVSFSDDNTGGVSLQVGDRIASTHANSNDDIYTVQSGAWTTTSLNDLDAFFVSYDLPDVQHQERRSLYKYNGTTIEEVADFDEDSADTIGLTGSYSETNGSVSSDDTIEDAIEKLDGNQQDIQTTTGVAQGSTHLGSFTGSVIPDNQTIKAALQALETDLDAVQTLTGVAAESTDLGAFTGSIIPDNQDIKAALQALETDTDAIQTALGIAAEAENFGSFTGQTIEDDRTVKEALQDLESRHEEQRYETTQSNVTSQVTLDSISVDDYDFAVWEVVAVEVANPDKKRKYRIQAMHNGTTTADASGTPDWDRSAALKVGAAITGLTFDVDLNGSDTSQVMRLLVSSTSAVNVKAIRTVL